MMTIELGISIIALVVSTASILITLHYKQKMLDYNEKDQVSKFENTKTNAINTIDLAITKYRNLIISAEIKETTV